MASNMSDFIIETTTKEYGSLASVDNCNDCEKNPGHKHFYSLDDLTVNDLPAGCRRDQCQWLNYIRDYSKRIVRIIINKPNGGSLFGTGCAFMRYDLDSDSYKFLITTNEHVIGSQEDVENCIVEWFFDTEDRVGIETSCGVELRACYKYRDLCYFSVNYIPETVKQLFLHPIDTPPVTNLKHIIAISHPHGAPKTVTFGKYLGCELVDGVYSWIHTAKTCCGSSGTRLIYTRDVYGLYSTHYAGQRGNVYKLKDDDGTGYKQVTSDTNNINYATWTL